MEQIRAISYDDAVTVSEYMESVPFTLEVMRAVPDERINQLFDMCEFMLKARLYPDTIEQANMLYHPEYGFRIIDYKRYAHDRASFLSIIQETIEGYLEPDWLATSEDREVRYELLERFRRICHERYAVTQPRLVRQIDRHFAHFARDYLGVSPFGADTWGAAASEQSPVVPVEGHGAEALYLALDEILQQIVVIEQGLIADVPRIQAAIDGLHTALAGSVSPFAAQARDYLADAEQRLGIILERLHQGRDDLKQFKDGIIHTE